MKLTLDIGGSKTRGFLYTANANEKIEIQGGFGKAEDCDCVDRDLLRSLQSVLSDKAEQIEAVAVNLGGKNKAQIIKTVSALCPTAHISVHRESEGILARRILQMHAANVLVMAGTGCIVFSQSEQGSRVLGGWGKDYGDEGSGYSLGIRAVRAALKDLDSGAEKTALLTQTLFGVTVPFRFRNIDEYAAARDAARSKIPKTRDGVAALTKTVVSCAEQGCALSIRLLDETGAELADLVTSTVRASNIQTPSVIINGGVTNFYPLWKEAFWNRVRQLEKAVSLVCINDGIDKALQQTVEEL